MAVGALALLWHESQELLQVDGTTEDIGWWAGLEDHDQISAFIEALLACRFIHQSRDRYVIHGNQMQIETRVKSTERAFKGGAATKARWDDIKKRNNSNVEATSYAQAMLGASLPASPTNKETKKQRNKEEGVASIPVEKNGRAHSTPKDLLALWNELRGNLPAAVALSKSRLRYATTRLRDHPDLGYWRDVITRITRSSFCCGSNDRAWKADFDFLIREGTHVKVLEGKYDDRAAQSAIDWDKVFAGAPK